MARYAMVNSEGVVENVCEWDGDTTTWQPPEGIIMVEIEDEFVSAEPGGTYKDGTFYPKQVENVSEEGQE